MNNEGEVGLKAIILTPTRELSIQVNKHLKDMVINSSGKLKYKKVKICELIGGMSLDKQRRKLLQNPDIIVATTGKTLGIIISIR
jgi:superfamily II DNA/RNA helicase